MARTRKENTPKIFNVVTVANDKVMESVTMSESELRAWLANNKEVDVKIFDGEEYIPETTITLAPIGTEQQPVEKPKRKYKKREKPASPAVDKLRAELDGKNGKASEAAS